MNLLNSLDFSSQIVLRTKKLTKTVQIGSSKLTILQDINLSIESGQTIALEGISGSGKTTLLSLLAGLSLPTSGEIWVLNQPLSPLSEDERAILRGHTMGFIFQSFELLPTLTALENVMLPLELLGKTEIVQKAKTLLARVGLAERLNHYPNVLSGGEKQRVAIARAFVLAPKILFADEPTANIDQNTADKIIDLLFELNALEKTTLLIATHDMAFSKRCVKTWLLEHGVLNV